jgi:hypothetical protein
MKPRLVKRELNKIMQISDPVGHWFWKVSDLRIRKLVVRLSKIGAIVTFTSIL